MTPQEFEAVLLRSQRLTREVLMKKAGEYAPGMDRFANFRRAAEFQHLSMEQVCWNFLMKHLVSVQDMVESGKEYPQEVWDEKLGDTHNYLHLLEGMVTGRRAKG